METELAQENERSYLLLEQQCVQGLSAWQNHHGEAHSHGHDEAHSDHLCHQVGGEVYQHVAGRGISEADVAKKPHLSEGQSNVASCLSVSLC